METLIFVILLLIFICLIGCLLALREQQERTRDVEKSIYRLIDIVKERLPKQ